MSGYRGGERTQYSDLTCTVAASSGKEKAVVHVLLEGRATGATLMKHTLRAKEALSMTRARLPE